MAKTPVEAQVEAPVKAKKRRIDPKVKAQTALDTIARKLHKAGRREEDLAAQMGQAADQRRALQAEYDYAYAHPLLRKDDDTTSLGEPNPDPDTTSP